ncbi:MAG: hypothetical protein P8J87_04325 [Verrucomicrobiales bacterium]|nr:hypothetical protein [Verrucomicrobiales bacterium]
MKYLQRGSGDGGLPVGDVFGEAEVGVEEVATGFEDTGDSGKEGGKIGVAVGCLDVDDGVEGAVGEGEVLGVAVDECQVFSRVAPLAEFYASGVEVEGGVACGVQGVGDPRGATTVAAADFEDVFAGEVDL